MRLKLLKELKLSSKFWTEHTHTHTHTACARTHRRLKSKGNRKQDERQPPEWEKIVANESTDKGLISKI